MVGPMWDQLQSAELSFFPSGMLEGPATRRVGVVRVLGSSAGWVHAPSLARSREPDCQAVISAVTGALRLRTLPPPGGLFAVFRTRRAAAAAALRPSSTATLRLVSAVSATLEWPSWSAFVLSSLGRPATGHPVPRRARREQGQPPAVRREDPGPLRRKGHRRGPRLPRRAHRSPRLITGQARARLHQPRLPGPSQGPLHPQRSRGAPGTTGARTSAVKRIEARLSGRRGPTCESGDNTVASAPRPGCRAAAHGETRTGARSAPVASGLQFA